MAQFTSLQSRIPGIMLDLPGEVDAAIKAGAEAIAEDAQGRVPVDSGALRDAIHVEQIPGGYSVVAGNDQAFYGHIVEHGGARTPSRPFLIPAFEAKRDTLLKAVEEALEDL